MSIPTPRKLDVDFSSVPRHWLAGNALGLRGTLRELRKMRADDPIVQRVFIAGIKQYIRRDFHPRDNANEHIAAQWFAARGLPFPEAA